MRVAAKSLFSAAACAAIALFAACTPPTGGGGSATTTTTPPTNWATCPAKGPGQVRVAVVIDSQELPGGSSSPSVVCVVVAQGSSGVTALSARATRIGAAQPRYNASGLLCAIDGAPAAPACGTPSGGGFLYWSYWIGGSNWTYANVGPAGRAMADGAVEGWRFISGGSPTAPTASPSFSALTN
ncbi:MAG: hypothetical protein IT195_08440 [Microthrixaceae bacterium]|nr:hypothetical protein [Microthrixaceae bacterium]